MPSKKQGRLKEAENIRAHGELLTFNPLQHATP
jgi:hypothetical protein